MKFSHNFWMSYALKVAYYKGFLKGEIPIGALIIQNNMLISTGYNKVNINKNPLAHAELIAIKQAIIKCKNKSIKYMDLSLYVTVEPCIMCTFAILHTRINKIIYGTSNKTMGGLGGKINLLNIKGIYKKLKVEKNVLKQKCYNLIHSFFIKLRYKNELFIKSN